MESGSIESYRAKYGRNVDAERKTQGVKGRSKLLSIISNQPLTSPIDVMHQLFLGVAKDLLTFFYECMISERKHRLNAFLSELSVPRELKNTVRTMDSLPNFKAKEYKMHLLYLAPIVLPSLLCGENSVSDAEDLKKLVFSIRELFERNSNSDACDIQLNEFCVSMTEKNEKFDSINFHLLRHLGWQAKNIGPLFTTSAATFETANRLLIAPLTGTVNFCQIIVQRFVRAKVMLNVEIREDSLSEFLSSYNSKPFFKKDYGFRHTENTEIFLRENPGVKLFCCFQSRFYFSSVAYERGSPSDNFVIIRDGDLIVGEVQFFYEDNGNHLLLKVFKKKRYVHLVAHPFSGSLPFAIVVEESNQLMTFNANTIASKLFPLNFDGEHYMLPLMSHYEHN